MTKERVLPIVRLLLVIAAPFLWYWLFGWGTVHIIDFSAQEVESVQISCSHYPERGTIYDPEEIQALIDEANAMQNKGSRVKLLLHGIGVGGSILYYYNFYLTDGTEFLLTFSSGASGDPVSEKNLLYWQYSPTGKQIVGPMCRGSMEVYFRLFEKYNHRPAPGAEQDAR
ncbi:hypothetical protein [Flintibacter faecis]|uniref:Uncharacterized protein n=1 Tax=Flintibacter faecis TaxID=2763047 RepID=A0A8J6J3W6_9FIRM|nr:hypothetical protein [Flintibacter faecis]MBC5716472.1 hypothetical protein [Flintibacter faecis]